MKIQILKSAAAIPAAELDDWGKVQEPAGEPVSRLRGREMVSAHGGAVEAGVWECTPGKWRRQVKLAEFCQFLSGRCRFHADSGERLEIRGGDAVFFPENSTGVWEVIETVRKTYLIFKPPA
jgi:hypothetical protein